ncbi:alanine racemase [Halothiobacillus neapolitanus]|uniref:Orn/DAP/Arg decarboxylase 2 n=1 Tax=Halothiobacillus neapolitanus (strain ATCC 23641 / DSM 15147 / CIP 104769 / NCIMB 8539 / c2) TaxID=555778 RepID=D0L1T4_HALNC|nr:alanine racemase [Halothiobacillus neapolitanus]ACX96657.1 Orn/DAP/Arg decarboxylase 2 [Halothiobacillus neapolitanus c2]TDN65232.1 diaminopimelate decarboxylase [Halothiobacillus neapolitanus]
MNNQAAQSATGLDVLHHCLGPAASAWPQANGRLLHGSEPLGDWLKRSGQSTPAYVYHLAAIDQQVAVVRAVLPSNLHLHYAIKANPNQRIIQHLSRQIDGFDCASLAEMQQIIAIAPDKAAQASIAGPAKSDDELAFAISHGILINAESANELRRIQALAAQKKQRARVALRINPPFEVKGSGMKMGGGARPFGIDSEDIPTLIRQWQAETSSWIDLEGFHLYTGSQNRDATALGAGFRAAMDLIIELSQACDFTPRHLNLGGGFGVVYHPQDAPLDLAALQPALLEVSATAQTHWPGVRLNLELGRYLVAGAGIYLTRIVDKKTSRGKTYLLCDGGMHHHLALSGNLGQILRRNWPIIAIDQLNAPCTHPFDLAGPLCTPLDVLGQNQELPELAVSDVIGVLQSGAYGLSASPNGFLSHPACGEYFLRD